MSDNPPVEIVALIEKHVEAFNAQDERALHSVFSDSAIIVDGIAPFRWLNPNAPSKWLADAEVWRESLGVISEHFDYKLTFWTVEGQYAYAAISGNLTVKMKAGSVVRSGILAYTFSKRGDEWKIDAQTWARMT